MQPWLHELVTSLKAPTVVLSERSGQLRADGAQGVLHADVRVLSQAVVTIGGEEPTPIGGGVVSAQVARFSSIARSLGDASPDPTVRLDRTRTVTAGSVLERMTITSSASQPVSSWLEVSFAADLVRVEQIKSGTPGRPLDLHPVQGPEGVDAHWSGADVQVELSAPGAVARVSGVAELVLRWPVDLAPGSEQSVEWTLQAQALAAPVIAVEGLDSLSHPPQIVADDHRLTALLDQSFTDLAALQMAPAQAPSQVFLAAGSPWFFTLFGRDSIWAARLLLPFGTELALGTLQALAARQGTKVDDRTAEAPGKIPHELRGVAAVHSGGHDGRDGGDGGEREMTLPPLYYGTIDATPLWICLLHDAWRWDLPDAEVKQLLPALQGALAWLRDYSDPDGDGFLEYLDAGHGLANQGWKDSGDSVRFSDGRIAVGPVALCEVQGYAYEAALAGAELLEHFGLDGADQWRSWAGSLASRFREQFWVETGGRRFPALALDGEKRRVDSLTSNIGHLLGTGILDPVETDLVAQLLVSDELSSGFGLRTMSTADDGFSALSYHCGSVWSHDTAIAIQGLARSGHGATSFALIEGLLAAGVAFDYRLPELYSGDARSSNPRPMPYPAACRPQAWAAAAIGPIIQALTGLSTPEAGGELVSIPPPRSPFGALTVRGLRHGPRSVTAAIDRDGISTLTSQ